MRRESGAPMVGQGGLNDGRKVHFVLLAALLVIASMTVLGACGNATDPAGDSRDTTAASPMPEATGEPLMFGFDEGFTGFMAMDVELGREGHPDQARHDPEPVGGPAGRVQEGRQRLRPGPGRRQGPPARRERRHPVHGRPDLLAGGRRRHRLPGQGRRHPAVLHRRAAERQPQDGQRPRLHAQRPVRLAGLLLRQVRGRAARLQDRQLRQPRGHGRPSAAGRLREGPRRERRRGRSARSTCRSTPSTSARTSRRSRTPTPPTSGCSATAPRRSSSSTTTTASPRRSSRRCPTTSASSSSPTSVSSAWAWSPATSTAPRSRTTGQRRVRRGLPEAVSGRVPAAAGLRRLPGGRALPAGRQGRRWRHDACDAHRGHVDHHARHAGRQRHDEALSRTRSSRSATGTSSRPKRSTGVSRGCRSTPTSRWNWASEHELREVAFSQLP